MYEKRTAFPITAKHLSLPRTISHLLCPGRIKQRDSRTLRESRRKTVGAAALIGAGSGWGPIAGILPKGELSAPAAAAAAAPLVGRRDFSAALCPNISLCISQRGRGATRSHPTPERNVTSGAPGSF